MLLRWQGKGGLSHPREGGVKRDGGWYHDRMWFRKLLAGGVLLSLLAPLASGVFTHPNRAASRSAAGGGSCCVAMPCCDTGGTCATGHCEKPARPNTPAPNGAAPNGAPRLAAGCPGPDSATPIADRDPMVAAAALDAPAPWPRAAALAHTCSTANDRSNDPTDPPPRV